MAELPIVEATRKALAPHLIGSSIRQVPIMHEDTVRNPFEWNGDDFAGLWRAERFWKGSGTANGSAFASKRARRCGFPS